MEKPIVPLEEESPEPPPGDDRTEADEADEALLRRPPLWRRVFRRKKREDDPLAEKRPLAARLAVLGVRVVAYGAIGLALLLVAVWMTVSIMVKPELIQATLKDVIEEQTGGRFDIGAVKFDVLSGISLENVQFYPPAPGDDRGFRDGGEVIPIPLANFDALVIGYSIPKALAGRMHLTALQLVEPQVHLRETDGVLNFQGILDYRAKRFPPAEAEEPPPEETPTEAGPRATPPEFLLSPSLAYMPIEIMARDIGIRNLRFDLVKEEGGRIAQIIMSNGLSLDLGMHWHGRKSEMWLSVLSPVDAPLEVSIQDAKRDEAGALLPELVSTLSVKTALSMRAELRDLSKIAYDLGMRIESVQTPFAGYEDVGVFTRVRLEADDNYKTLRIGTVEADLAGALSYALGGRIAINNYAAEQITLKLSQRFALNLDAAARLAKPFVPELAAGGEINADEIEIEGTLEPEKLKAALAKGDGNVPIPYVWGVVWLEEIWASLPGTGLSMEPISGDVQLSVGPAMNGGGSQLDLDVEMVIPEVGVAHTAPPPVGAVQAGVKDMSVKLTARALVPELVAPVFKLDVEAAHVRASGAKIAPLDVPMIVDVDADGRADLQRVSFSSAVELTDLLDFTASADCQSRCTRFRSNAAMRLDSLAKLHAVALPLGGALGLAEFMPTKLTGGVDFQFQARGTLPDPLATPPLEIPRLADVRWNLTTSIDKLDAKVPFFDVDLKGFGTRVLAGGTTKEQRIELMQRFERFAATLPMKGPDDKPLRAEVSRFNFETEIQNSLAGELDVSDVQALIRQLSTDVRTKLSIGRVAGLDGIAPKPISDLAVAVELAQQRLTDVQLKDLTVRVPDYGVHVDMTADARLGDDFMPKRAKLDLKTDVSLTGAEPLPMGLKTSGGMSFRLAVATDDMKIVSVDGGTAFDRFNVTVPDFSDATKPPLLVVEDMRGEIPFKQSLNLPELQKLAAPDNPAPPLPGQEAPTEQVAQSAKTQQQLNAAVKKYFDKNEDKLLKSANLASIVDYGTVRPFYPERRPLSIKRIEAANLELSKLEFDIELRQNWFALNQFLISFLGGKIQGDMQLAFDPLPRFIRTTVHMTKLDTRRLIDRFPNLKGKASSWSILSGDPEIDGTVRFSYDVKANDMNGGVEITKIGKEQLRMMLYYVDPYEQNPTISDIRAALALGEVKGVSIPLKNGQVGLEVDVKTLGVVPILVPKLSNFPISQIVDNFKQQLMAAQQQKATASSDAEDDGPPPADATPAGGAPPAATPPPEPTGPTVSGIPEQKGA